VTKSFRQLFKEELNRLKFFQEALMDPARRDAFDCLKRAASSELGALTYSYILTAFDGILLAGAVDNRKILIELSEYSKKLEENINDLRKQVVNIEKLFEDHAKYLNDLTKM
jgi:hypothetical protein